jgi:hypothetical protein
MPTTSTASSDTKARTQLTEIAWVFFGMMTANASIISKLINQRDRLRQTG